MKWAKLCADRRLAAGTAATVAVLIAGHASVGAYVRTTAASHEPLAWSSGCIFVAPAEEATTDIPGALIQPVFDRVLANWQNSVASCSYMRIKADPALKDQEVGLDSTNVVKFRQGRWCRPARKDTPEKCYMAFAAGITTVFYVDKASDPEDGRILDADIELNAVNFRFAVAGQTNDNTAGQTIADYENTLTHEVGHLLGLDHTCNDDPENPTTDELGNRTPSCSATLTPAMRAATMFPFQDDGELSKVTLEADDIAGICAAYPKNKDPGSCERVALDSGGGCSLAHGIGRGARSHPGLLAEAGLFMLFLVLLARRSRRPRCASL